MTLPAFALPADLAARLPDGTLDEGRAQALLEDASAAVRSRAGRSWCNDDGSEVDWGDLALFHRDEIVRITVAAAKRSYTNPQSVKSTTTGPFSTAFADASPDVFLTAQEKASIDRAVSSLGVLPVGIGTIATTRDDPAGATVTVLGFVDDRFGNVWVDTTDGGSIPFIEGGELG